MMFLILLMVKLTTITVTMIPILDLWRCPRMRVIMYTFGQQCRAQPLSIVTIFLQDPRLQDGSYVSSMLNFGTRSKNQRDIY